ncbi:MAG TPA: hypothetical protein V6C99_04095 [Oculatellaceae cyanobacterium]|jgi:DNA-binding beta-propeller fold protein YncE
MKKLLLAIFCLLTLTSQALATELPAGVLNYIRMKDPNVKVRFDGMVLFSNGETYLPVIPQEISSDANIQNVVSSFPANADYPDLIEFDHHFFLMRLIRTASGRLTLPKMEEYPIQLKEGLLPQDLVMPPNLFIPVELKVLLGALPYNPSFSPNPEPILEHFNHFQGRRLSYVYDLNSQQIIAIDPILGHKQTEITLDCIPSDMRLNPDNSLLFVSCLSTNELLAIDTNSNLVKTRVPVGQRPDSILYLDALQAVVVSNRYSGFLSLVNTKELLTAEKIMLPEQSYGGVMATVPGDPNHLLVADAFQPKLYWINLTTRTVEKTLKAVEDISAIKATLDAHAQPEIWVASRTENKVALLNLSSDAPIMTLDVGKKPSALALDGERLFVLSAGDSRLDVIDWTKRTLLTTIPLTPDSFPTGMASVLAEHKAYITMAGNTEMAVVDTLASRLESTLPVEFRANLIATTPDLKAEEEQAAVIAKHIPPAPPVGPLVEEGNETIGPESPKNKKDKKRGKEVSTPVQTVQSEQAPRVMPVLRNQGYLYGNDDSGLNQANPLNIPFSRSKSKKPEVEPAAPIESLPMLEGDLSK